MGTGVQSGIHYDRWNPQQSLRAEPRNWLILPEIHLYFHKRSNKDETLVKMIKKYANIQLYSRWSNRKFPTRRLKFHVKLLHPLLIWWTTWFCLPLPQSHYQHRAEGPVGFWSCLPSFCAVCWSHSVEHFFGNRFDHQHRLSLLPDLL